MAAHSIDGIHLKVVLSALLIITILTLGSVMKDAPSCWHPSHFTGSQKVYATNACRNYIMQVSKNGYSFPPLFIHLIAECTIILAVYIISTHIASYALQSSSLVKTAWKDAMYGRQMAYSMRKQLINLLNSHGIAVLYFLIQTAALICWIGAATSSAHLYKPNFNNTAFNSLIPERLQQHSEQVFMCEFEVRNIGGMIQYTVQCEIPTTNTLDLSVTANNVLCFLMAASTLIHLLHTFVVSPLMQKGNVAMLIQEASKAPMELGVRYGFTNLHMVTSLCPMSTEVAKLEDAGENGQMAMPENIQLYPYIPSQSTE